MTGPTYGQNAAPTEARGMKKAQAWCAVVLLTWAFVWSRLGESNP